MIYDLFELPMRNVSGELSSVLPRFQYLSGIDDVNWYGRTLDLNYLKQDIHKYKSIEPIGNMTIERIFMTHEPIDFKKKWFTSNMDIQPIMYKVYKQPFTAECDVYRYLNGSVNILGSIDGDCELQSINNRLIHQLFPYGHEGCVNPHTSHMLPHVVTGNDNINLSNYATMHEFMEHEEAFPYVEAPLDLIDLFPTYPNDKTDELFIRDIKLSNLKPLVTNQCQNGIFRNVMNHVATPFEINQSTLFNEDCENYRWVLHDLIQSIERSVYTDMYLCVEFRTQHKVVAHTDLFSRYIGLTKSSVPGAKRAIENIVELLRKWANLTSGGTLIKIELWKNWAEEIFIQIKTDKNVSTYYFDIPTYSLANLSFVDMIG